MENQKLQEIAHLDRCPTCSAKIKKYWHALSIGMVRALIKTHRAVKMKGVNDIAIDKLPKDMALTHNERCNWQKLRLHGLVARIKVDGQVKRGRWLITKKGYKFLNGDAISARVLSFRNQVIDHDPEMVTIRDVLKGDLYFENIDTIQSEIAKLPFAI